MSKIKQWVTGSVTTNTLWYYFLLAFFVVMSVAEIVMWVV